MIAPAGRAREQVFLTGFMGSGKSAVGRRLADLLERPFADLDQEVEAVAGAPISRLFESEGEAGFRRRESAALATLADGRPRVIATGGGTVTVEANRALMLRTGVCVWLDAPFELLVGRLVEAERERRPLFRDAEQARELYRERLPAYRRADLRIEVAPGDGPEEVAQRTARRLREQACAT